MRVVKKPEERKAEMVAAAAKLFAQQGFALLALVPIWLYRGRQGCHSKPFQYACYAFYPVHMLLLVLALNFVNR
mgnify:CR=1 FL=1